MFNVRLVYGAELTDQLGVVALTFVPHQLADRSAFPTYSRTISFIAQRCKESVQHRHTHPTNEHLPPFVLSQ
jgi:hypothetical protein